MAFTCAAGKHRRPGRVKRTTTNAVGVAALATTGVIGTLAAPALAAGNAVEQTGLTQAVAQKQAAEQKAAQEAARRKAAEQAAQARVAKERAAREAERKRLNAFVPPISNSYVSTGYKTGGSLWSSGSHTGIDFHAAMG